MNGLRFTVQKAVPLLPDGASIILNASIVGGKRLSMNSVYSAGKAALRWFARTWRTDLKDRHIRVNAVSPGSIDTPGLGDLLVSATAGEERKTLISKTRRARLQGMNNSGGLSMFVSDRIRADDLDQFR